MLVESGTKLLPRLGKLLSQRVRFQRERIPFVLKDG